MSRRKFFPLVLLTLLLVVSYSSLSSAQRKGGVFRSAHQSDPPTLDPAHVTDTTSHRMVALMFDGLVDFDLKTLEPNVPAIAKNWKISPDGRVYTFYLRKGVKFHNGREVKATDFKYSFERVLNPKTKSKQTWVLDKIQGAKEMLAGKVTSVEGIKVIDDYTLEITLEKPFAPFLSLLAMPNAFVIPKEEVEKWGEDFTKHPCGTGAFKFVEWKHDDHLTFEANPEYFRGVPYLDKIIARIIPEAATRLQEYKAGNIEVVDIPPGQLKKLKEDPVFSKQIILYPTLGTYYFGLNCEKEPFKNNIKLRQAINYAIDREGICNVIREGAAIPAKGVLPPGMPGYNPKLKGYTYNVEKAQKLLADAGYPGGKGLPEITLWWNVALLHQQIGQYVQANLQAIGINVSVKQLDWAAYLNACRAGEPQMFRLGWVADYPDPENFLKILFHTSRIGSNNYARYSNPEVDKLLDEADTLTSFKERMKLYQKAEEIIVAEAPWVFVFHYVATGLLQPYVKGFETCSMDNAPEFGHTRLEKVWLER